MNEDFIMEEQYPKDPEEIRDDLETYFGTAMCSGFPMAVFDLNELENMNEEELRELHESLGL